MAAMGQADFGSDFWEVARSEEPEEDAAGFSEGGGAIRPSGPTSGERDSPIVFAHRKIQTRSEPRNPLPP